MSGQRWLDQELRQLHAENLYAALDPEGQGWVDVRLAVKELGSGHLSVTPELAPAVAAAAARQGTKLGDAVRLPREIFIQAVLGAAWPAAAVSCEVEPLASTCFPGEGFQTRLPATASSRVLMPKPLWLLPGVASAGTRRGDSHRLQAGCPLQAEPAVGMEDDVTGDAVWQRQRPHSVPRVLTLREARQCGRQEAASSVAAIRRRAAAAVAADIASGRYAAQQQHRCWPAAAVPGVVRSRPLDAEEVMADNTFRLRCGHGPTISWIS